jgi:peptidoglycan/LPS O-acetylase OafA/YrhL
MNITDTVLLRFIAIGLVLNSHLDLYYPVDHVGTGGAIGNVLFFMLSSYGLLLSEQRKPQSFMEYLAKRIRRIYPTVWIVLLFIVLPIHISKYSMDFDCFLLFLKNCIIPPFWFLQALMLYYLVGFFVIKKYSKSKLFTILAIAFVAYLYCYVNYLDLTMWSVECMPFKLMFYVMVFLFGILLADVSAKIQYSGISDIVMCFFAIFVLYGHKYLMTKHLLSNLQIVQQLVLFVIVFYVLKVSRAPFFQDGILRLPFINNIIYYISGITLELYVVHVTISSVVLNLKYSFPLNAAFFLTASFIIAAIVKWISCKVLLFWYPSNTAETLPG